MSIPKNIQPIAREWSANLFTDKIWRMAENQSVKAGEAGGFEVVADNFPHRCWLKPTNPSDHSNHPRAANEKIVSDLGTKLELPISPVLLFHRENCPAEHDSCACVSLIMYPEQFPMSQIKEVVGPARTIIDSVVAKVSGIVALDTYIGHQDREGNDDNVIFGYNPRFPAESAFVFLDYSNSLNMNNRWAGQGWKNVDAPPVYSQFQKAVDINVLMETAQKIEALADEFIQHIVARIPEQYMPSAHKDIVAEGLIGRRQLIRQVLSNRFAV